MPLDLFQDENSQVKQPLDLFADEQEPMSSADIHRKNEPIGPREQPPKSGFIKKIGENYGKVMDFLGKKTPLRAPLALVDVGKLAVGTAVNPVLSGISDVSGLTATGNIGTAQKMTQDWMAPLQPKMRTPEGETIEKALGKVSEIISKVARKPGEAFVDLAKGEEEYYKKYPYDPTESGYGGEFPLPPGPMSDEMRAGIATAFATPFELALYYLLGKGVSKVGPIVKGGLAKITPEKLPPKVTPKIMTEAKKFVDKLPEKSKETLKTQLKEKMEEKPIIETSEPIGEADRISMKLPQTEKELIDTLNEGKPLIGPKAEPSVNKSLPKTVEEFNRFTPEEKPTVTTEIPKIIEPELKTSGASSEYPFEVTNAYKVIKNKVQPESTKPIYDGKLTEKTFITEGGKKKTVIIYDGIEPVGGMQSFKSINGKENIVESYIKEPYRGKGDKGITGLYSHLRDQFQGIETTGESSTLMGAKANARYKAKFTKDVEATALEAMKGLETGKPIAIGPKEPLIGKEKPVEQPVTPTEPIQITEAPIELSKPINELPMRGRDYKTNLRANERLAIESVAKEIMDEETAMGLVPEKGTRSSNERSIGVFKVMNENPKLALDIALGKENAPRGYFPEDFYKGVKKKAILNGDVNTIQQLIESKFIGGRARLHGQKLQALVDSLTGDIDPVKYAQILKKVREEMVVRKIEKDLGKVKIEEMAPLEKVIKKTKTEKGASKKSWLQTLEEITCK